MCAKIWKDSYTLKYSIVAVGGEGSDDFLTSVEVLDEDGTDWRPGRVGFFLTSSKCYWSSQLDFKSLILP